jgi:AAA15 family ATPase/GTPase
MLIEFAVTNFRSIKEKQIFSMMPAGKIKLDALSENIIPEDSNHYNISLLKSSLFFGANASGKSNFLKAIMVIKYLVEKSINFKLDEKIEFYEPFKLNEANKKEPVELEIDFIAKDGIRYIYKVIFNEKEFMHESLYFYPQKQKAKIFIREQEKPISYGDYFKGEKKHQLLRNQLLLSKAGTIPIESLKEPYRFFTRYLFCSIFHNSDYDNALIRSFTKRLVEEKEKSLHHNFKKLLCAADTGITSFTIKEFKTDEFKLPAELSEEIKKKIADKFKYQINTVHRLYDNENFIGEEAFDLNEESTGTIKLLAVGIFILDALSNGTTIILDELDKSLHPLLTRMLINLFHSKETNLYQSQLIFVTHDIAMIDISFLRRDQIWLTQKNDYGATEIYPLSDFTGISKVKPIENWYLRGRFGGIPIIKDFELNLEFENEEK